MPRKSTGTPCVVRYSEVGVPDVSLAWQLASLALADFIESRDFDLREMIALGVLRNLTFSIGRAEARIPTYDHWAVAMRVSRGNACTVVRTLVRMQVIERPEQDVYGFRMPLEEWIVPPRTESIEAINQLVLMEEPHCGSGARLVFVEQFAKGIPAGVAGFTPGSGDDRVQGTRSHQAPDVPEFGTSGASPKLFPKKERDASDSGGGQLSHVPESGTDHVHVACLQPCSLAVVQGSLEQDYKAAIKHAPADVPKSGTEGRLDPERQELMDELRAVGAFGKQDESKGSWLTFVRKRPGVTRELLGDLRYRLLTGSVTNAGGWLMDRWIRWGRPNDK